MAVDPAHARDGLSGRRAGFEVVTALRIVTGTEALEPIGGVEICIYEDSEALADRGHDITLLYTRDGVHRPDFEAMGVRLRGPVRFLFRPSRALCDAVMFIRSGLRLRRLEADVLWLNRPETIIWAQVVSFFTRMPIVVVLHHWPNFKLERFLMTGVKEYLAVSQYMKNEWIKSGVPAERVTVVYNAVPPEQYPVATDAERQAAREALGIPAGARVAMYFGRIIKAKGVLSVLEAWKELGYDPSEAVLLLVGDGLDADADIRAAFDALPEGTVRHVPNRRDVIELLHAVDLVVAPAWKDEPFGRTHIEAMSAGIPAIGADHSGTAEILGGGMERLLVPRRDTGAVARKIRELLDWRTTEPGLGDAVRAHVERRFPYKTHVDEVEAILRKHSRRHRRQHTSTPESVSAR